uniref:Chemokine interleukin-8-like domain-containing protein n=1 Tax=Myripristis murdjan TaxID=586833 RepID=A0A667ZY64_9TELE
MANCKLCVLAALCSLLILATFTGSTQSASCCLSYTRRVYRCKQLMNYSIQTINGSCDISAVIFNIQNKFVCANPNEPWVMRGIKCLK